MHAALCKNQIFTSTTYVSTTFSLGSSQCSTSCKDKMELRWNLRILAWRREWIPSRSPLVAGRRPGIFVTLRKPTQDPSVCLSQSHIVVQRSQVRQVEVGLEQHYWVFASRWQHTLTSGRRWTLTARCRLMFRFWPRCPTSISFLAFRGRVQYL